MIGERTYLCMMGGVLQDNDEDVDKMEETRRSKRWSLYTQPLIVIHDAAIPNNRAQLDISTTHSLV